MNSATQAEPKELATTVPIEEYRRLLARCIELGEKIAFRKGVSLDANETQYLAAPTAPTGAQAEPRPLFDPEFPSQGYVTDAQWAARKVRSPAALLDKIEICAFSCEAGPLVLCEDWQRLREILAAQPVAGHQGEVSG